MSSKLTQNDWKVLEFIAEHRMLTTGQMAISFNRDRQIIRRRVRDLQAKGLIKMSVSQFGRNRGRPQKLLGLTEEGIDLIKDNGIIGQDIPYEKVLADTINCVEHQLLLNWFRIHLKHIERVLKQLKVRVLAYNSPFLPKNPNGGIYITDYSPVPGYDEPGVKFTPDAAIFITDTERQITCLYFLEVDMGTETVVSPRRDMTDIRQKILNYQWYVHMEKYKRYDKFINCNLFGYRLLFLTHHPARFSALCRLVQQMQPNNFIWLTEYDRIVAKSISERIWAKGGEIYAPQESMLDSLCCKAPLPQL